MSTTTAPTALICTSSTAGEPVWWVECSCGWNHPEHRTQEDTVEPTPATLTPYQVCPYCDATDETCPAAKTERACCECTHPGIEH